MGHQAGLSSFAAYLCTSGGSIVAQDHNVLGEAGVVRAFADDTAIILKSTNSVRGVISNFLQYATFSQLAPSFQKTMVIPLFYPDNLSAAAKELQSLIPQEIRLTYVRKAFYLGVLLGPDSIEHGWLPVLQKF